ncbi:MAG: MOSC domain-containing protein [Pseudomonadota bacterium]
MTGSVVSLTTYPVKGLSGQALDRVELEPGRGFPMDRAFGFARADSGFDPDNPKPLPKDRFLVLMVDAALASVATRFDPETRILEVNHGEEIETFDLAGADGCEAASRHFATLTGLDESDLPRFVVAEPHRFTDVSVVSPELMNAVSLINRTSVEAFAEAIGKPVDPMRFRGNIVFEGCPAFSELDRVGAEIWIGATRLEVMMRTKRCAATEVNPDTAERDLRVPNLLRRTYGHFDMGVYARVIEGGPIVPGDPVTLIEG